MGIADRKEINTICVYGVGGVGGYFGGRIAHAIGTRPGDGRKVFFVARGRHLEEIKRHGLILNTSEKQAMKCRPFLATDNTEEISAPDLCLLCVKSYDLLGAVKDLSRIMTSDTVIIPLLNGIDIYERVRSVLREGIVLPACAYVGTHIEVPGAVTQKGAEGVILCGKDPMNPDFNPEFIVPFFNDLGIRLTWIDDPFPAIWEKYIFIAAYGLVTACTGKTLGEVLAERSLMEIVEKIMSEIALIAERKGIRLPDRIVATSLEKARRFTFETKTSYQRDIEAQGKRNEGDLFGETIIQLGRSTGAPTPVTQSVYSKIQDKKHIK